ncbi:hypothetical protein CAL29_01535 [Bordetella genomosp. 10]|uniref:Ketopantoate reductase N-terminal domain-containing protein n=1 Tax=Bordetella genomosp. 10 TaxID=1416804 RepID=A0A261SI75_9BORD|nr:hypothetical protein CAL29_01535 [Bordetella genomosp. 10]
MKIAVLGAGAIGSFFAACLARTGLPVSVVVRKSQVKAIRTHGLRYQSEHESWHVAVAATVNARGLGPQDAVIVAAEAHTRPGSVADLLPLLDASTPVIFAVNGLPWRYFHKHRLSPIACLTLATGKEVAETPVLCDLFARCISETGRVPKRLMCKSTSSRGRAACGRRRTGRRCSRICLPASLWRSMRSRSQHRSGHARQFDMATPTLDLLLALLLQRADAAARRSLPGA